MNKFTYTYPTRVYFGEGIAAEALNRELPQVGKTVLLAYGGGSIKRSGIYEEIRGLLTQAGKEVVTLRASCPTPPMQRCSRAPNWPGSARWTSSWPWAAEAWWTAAR